MINIRKYTYTLAVCSAVLCGCNQELLDFSPTSSGSGDAILSSASTAVSSLNGIYRSMHTSGWSTTSNTHHSFGIPAHMLSMEVMGDDFIMQARGNGWFWQEHCYNNRAAYTSSSGRQVEAWYANYRWINNANNIIAYEETMTGSDEDKAYVLGQAYAIRAFCYFNLARWFSKAPIATRAYVAGERGDEVEHWSDKCVPIYTEPTTIETTGNARATIRQVYDQIESDFETAVDYLEKGQESVLNTGNKSYLDLYAALLLQSRVYLAENEWSKAYEASKRVIDEGGYTVGTESDLMNGMNLLSLPNVIWGADIQNSEQSSSYAAYFGHMDSENGAYAKSAPKLISKTLYNKIGENDIRRKWWDPDNEESPYISKKFSFSNVSGALGDVPYLRVEEAYFNAAEAALRLGETDEARAIMNVVMAPRDPSYNAANYSGTALGATTNTYRGTLLENIILQKRIELWGEFGRVWDVRRLGQGITRSESNDGYASACITTMNNKGIDISYANTWDWVLMIPQAEIDANPNINDEDQNS
ncbi:MAG: RagB/SusD family nutrient uptake outer membrane protein [Bacteroidales bacterium]|nr:RagB/SusD family nutrient uptake outer membrane protein [Bacteroidales bacterium]